MISIVMAYHNRLELLRYSLKTFAASKVTDFEVVIVDDFSNPDQSPKLLIDEFPGLNLKIIDMAEVVNHKYYCNPCVPFNEGFRQSSGDLIIIQNPECSHYGDVMQYVLNNITDNNYLCFHCFASSAEQLGDLHMSNTIDIDGAQALNPNGNCWYVHGEHRPIAWHFTSAMSRQNLKLMNGFDERLAYGRCSDDVEFLYRIKHLGLDIQFVDEPFVIHQWHPRAGTAAADDNRQKNTQLSFEILKAGIVRADNTKNIE